jgi:hypothetical protein
MKNSFHFSLSWLPDSDDNGNLVMEHIDVCYWPFQEQAGEPAGLRVSRCTQIPESVL